MSNNEYSRKKSDEAERCEMKLLHGRTCEHEMKA